jgi:hypothetical protein
VRNLNHFELIILLPFQLALFPFGFYILEQLVLHLLDLLCMQLTQLSFGMLQLGFTGLDGLLQLGVMS